MLTVYIGGQRCIKTFWFRRNNSINIQKTEIDLLVVSATFDKHLVGECKFNDKLFSYGEYLDTVAKLSQLKEKADFYYYLFSENGFDEKIISKAGEKNKIKLGGIEEIVNKNLK